LTFCRSRTFRPTPAEICEQRAIGLWSLATHRAPITIMPVASALLRIEPGQFYKQLALRLKVGKELPLEEVVAHLESIGYVRREPVEMVGEYSVRGGILDVFSPEAAKPVRVDLFGDQVESIRRFDLESQRSVLKVEDCVLLPLTEYQRSRPFLAELGEVVREAGIPGRDLPPPGEAGNRAGHVPSVRSGISGWAASPTRCFRLQRTPRWNR
jgi:transcription-repair coupling factor (superfamily II helicase)